MNKPFESRERPETPGMTEQGIKDELLKRLETYEADKANASPWAVVKARLLQPKPGSN